MSFIQNKDPVGKDVAVLNGKVHGRFDHVEKHIAARLKNLMSCTFPMI